MKNKKLDLKILELSLKNHFGMFNKASSFSNDFKVYDKTIKSNDIKVVKKALMALFLSNVEKEINIYTKSLLDAYEPHSKELQEKIDKLYYKMLKDIFSNKVLESNKKVDKSHTKKERKCEKYQKRNDKQYRKRKN